MNSIKAFLRPVYPAMALALLPYPVMAQSHSENPPLEHPHDYQHDRKDGITLAAALQLAGVSSPVIAAAQAQMDIATGNEQQAAYGPIRILAWMSKISAAAAHIPALTRAKPR